MACGGALWRLHTAVAAAWALLSLAGFAPVQALGLDATQMSADEIMALQQRLTDAGCYKGAVDGTASDSLDAATGACPDQRPFLRIETGMHTAPIWHVGVDAACRLIATASNDKTLRLWSLPDGRLQRVVRLPLGEGDAGEIYATALSPDGRWLASGGSDAAWDKTRTDSLTIIDLATGSIRRLGAFQNVINAIAFSADGQRVAVGLGATGVRVLDSATGAELLVDRDYGDGIFDLAFTSNGGLITSSFDGQLRRYGRDLKVTVKLPAPDGKEPKGVAVDPSGRLVAIGYQDETSVSILDARTLAPLAKAQTDDLTNGDLQSVAWSRDGATLVAGGDARRQFNGTLRRFLRRFDTTGRRLGADVGASSSTIFEIQRCGEGVAFGAADPSFGLLSPQGVATILQSPHTADLQDFGLALAVSRDASSVRFGLGLSREDDKPVAFDLAAASLNDSPNLSLGLMPAKVDGLPVTDWRDNYAPKFNGAKLALEDHEFSRALAVRRDASGFALGTDWWVRAYDANGKERWRRTGPGVAWGVNLSADGEILAVAFGDGTIRWLRWRDGLELLALFVEPQSRKWVAWTPTGYYMASAGGEDLIGWHVNRGWVQEADFFKASQFRALYNRPDIVRLILQTRDEAEAVERANKAAGHAVEAKPIALSLPPVIAITSPAQGAHFSGGSVELGFSLRSPSGLPIDRLDVLADGEPISATGFEKTEAPEAKGRVVAPLPKNDTTISLIAYSGGLTSAPAAVKLVYDRPNVATAPVVAIAPDPRPKLYALLVGVTNYEDNELNDIHFGGVDAEALAEALERQKGGLYADVQTKIVDFPSRPDIVPKVIGPPTRDNVFKGLYWLKQVMTDNDLAIIFLSGHGYRDLDDPRPEFWFLTRETNTNELPTTAISGTDLFKQITGLAGKKILFIDACHVGTDLNANTMAVPAEAYPNMDKFVNDFTTAGSGLVVYAASQATELAHEDPDDRHGAFAEALIESIGEGKGANPDGRITTDLLHFYIVERVKSLTKGAQHPVWNHPGPVSDFPVALLRR
jgi:Caspase domain